MSGRRTVGPYEVEIFEDDDEVLTPCMQVLRGGRTIAIALTPSARGDGWEECIEWLFRDADEEMLRHRAQIEHELDVALMEYLNGE